MAEDKKPESLMTKRRIDLTPAEIASLKRPVGISGLPYPKIKLVEDAQGNVQHQVQIVQDTRNPIVVFSDMSTKKVNGIMYREMAIPAMMHMTQKILERTDPSRSDRIIALLGEASYGKSHEFKKIGRMLHPEGAIQVDCGGMNMHEILFRTVIDYGKGVKDLFDKRVESGKVSADTLATLESEFPGAVMRKPVTVSDNGSTTSYEIETVKINWDAVGKPAQDAEGKTTEDRGDAVRRAKGLMEFLYEKEGITIQNNSFGVKTVPGELYESWISGRPLLLDELTKAIPESLDVLNTVTQVFNGESPSARVYNPMSESGEGADNDSPKYLDFDAKDMRASWILGVAGNEASDGITTHELSKSLGSRLYVMRVGDAGQADWAHRTSQVWTGLPLTTLYTVFGKAAQAQPEAFAKFLVDLRKLELSADEVNAIPPHQIEFLMKYTDTVKAANQVSTFWSEQDQLSREDSPLLMQDAYKGLVDELGEGARHIGVTFRTITASYNDARHTSPEARPVSEAVVNLDLASTFNNLDTSVIGQTAPGWHSFGANLAEAIRWNIVNATVGMKKTRGSLMKLAKDNGITPEDFKEALPSEDIKPLSQLLKFEENPEVAGSEELQALRTIATAAIRAQWKNIRQSDEGIIPMVSLIRAVKELEEQKQANPYTVIVPNDDVNTIGASPLVAAQAIPAYNLPDDDSTFELMDFRAVLGALVAPKYMEETRERLWPVGFTERLDNPPDMDKADKVEPYNIGEGKGKWGFNLTVLNATNEKQEQVFMWLIEDKVHLDKTQTDWHRYMLVGPEPISPDLESQLAKGGVQYVVKDDANTVDAVNNFLVEGARVRGEDNKMAVADAKEVTEMIVKAFAVLCPLPRVMPGTDPNEQIIPADATLGDMIHEATASPALFTSVMKPKVKVAVPAR
ncbi:MAG: hypothetical protein PSY14_02135 [bacterium]|nr:hypothetical protein [bacterium]